MVSAERVRRYSKTYYPLYRKNNPEKIKTKETRYREKQRAKGIYDSEEHKKKKHEYYIARKIRLTTHHG